MITIIMANAMIIVLVEHTVIIHMPLIRPATSAWTARANAPTVVEILQQKRYTAPPAEMVSELQRREAVMMYSMLW